MENISNYDKMEVMNHPKWSSVILDQLNQMFQNEQLFDVFLTTSDATRIGAHKAILGASSVYFFNAFTDTANNATQMPTELQLVDIDGTILKLLVNFAYTGVLDLSFETVKSVMKVACDLKFHAVIELCCGFLSQRLNEENCCYIEEIGDRFNQVELAKQAHNFVLMNFPAVSQGEGFMATSKEKLKSYLSTDDLNVSSEEDVFHALMLWTLYKSFQRLSSVPELLPLVRLTLLKDTFIFDEVQNFAVGNNCAQLVLDALNWKFIPSRRDQINPKFSLQPRKIKTDIIALGGAGNGSQMAMERYSTKTNSWSSVESSVKLPNGCAIVEINGTLFVLGGSQGQRRDYGIANVFRLNGGLSGESQVDTLPNMITARTDHSAVVLNGSIYVAGGRNGPMTLASIERFDPSTNTWTNLHQMSIGRYELNLAALNNRLYIVGGTTTDKEHPNESFDSVEYYNPSTDQWTAVAPMNRRRSQSAVAVANGHLYVFGGYDNDLSVNAPTDTVEFYNPEDNRWTLVAAMSSARYGFCAIPFLDSIIVAGGKETFKQRVDVVEKYDVEKDSWSKMESLNYPRSSFNLCLVKNDF